jgi:hypothetical protein
MNATTTTMSTQQQTMEISTVTKFRFVYSPEIETILREFAKEHEGEERKQFKQSWGVFMEENKLLLDNESKRIKHEGYSKDVYAKMFHTIKYYYVKKSKKQKQQQEQHNQEEKEEKEEKEENTVYESHPPKQRSYNKLGKQWIQTITTFIKDDLESYKHTKEMKPEYSYNRFLEKHATEDEELQLRVKKSYKTQYYKIKTHKKIVQ